MSTGQFFAPAFCEFRYATFYRKSPLQKTAGYMGVEAVEKGVDNFFMKIFSEESSLK